MEMLLFDRLVNFVLMKEVTYIGVQGQMGREFFCGFGLGW